VLLRTADSSAIRIYLSTEVTDRKLYTLMHDPQYRAEVARQQTTYNQPSYPGFYLASDIDWSKVPLPREEHRKPATGGSGPAGRRLSAWRCYLPAAHGWVIGSARRARGGEPAVSLA
jgi:hypothetical protein